MLEVGALLQKRHAVEVNGLVGLVVKLLAIRVNHLVIVGSCPSRLVNKTVARWVIEHNDVVKFHVS